MDKFSWGYSTIRYNWLIWECFDMFFFFLKKMPVFKQSILKRHTTGIRVKTNVHQQRSIHPLWLSRIWIQIAELSMPYNFERKSARAESLDKFPSKETEVFFVRAISSISNQ